LHNASELDGSDLNQSPSAQRQSRRNIEKEAATNIDSITDRLTALSLHSNDREFRPRSTTTEGVVGKVTLEPLVGGKLSSKTDEHEMNLLGENRNKTAKAPLSGAKTKSKNIAKNALNSSALGKSAPGEVHQQKFGQSTFVPTSGRPEGVLQAKESSQPSSPNDFNIRVSLTSGRPGQLGERARSLSAPQPGLSPKLRRRLPRKVTSSLSKLREVESHVIDLTLESQASSKPSRASEEEQLKHDCDTLPSEHVDLPTVVARDVPKSEMGPDAPEEPVVATTKFENFHEKKTSNDVKLEVLRILCRKKWRTN
jgi:hypothetical protein